MCGIFGVISKKVEASRLVQAGLKNLDYRGYDSWGVCSVVDGKLDVVKEVGLIPETPVKALKDSTVSLGHTRWATHGGVTQKNAHPHLAPDHSFAVVQNGVVENFVELKKELVDAGVTFVSETDTEVIVHLLDKARKSGLDWLAALQHVFARLKGRNTFGVITKECDIWAVRQGSPLVIGRGTAGIFISSDSLSCAEWVQELAVVDNGQVVHCSPDEELIVREIDSAKEVSAQFKPFGMEAAKADLGGYDHFLIKEIFETPQVLHAVASQDEKGMASAADSIAKAKKVFVIGSGSAGVASVQMAYYLRSIAGIPATSLVGAESESWLPFMKKGTVVIAPSQSGETADVLRVLEPAKAQGATIITYVNMAGSMMTRMADHAFMAGAGPERSVMSTKVLSSQCAWGYLLAKTVIGKSQEARTEITKAAEVIQKYIAQDSLHHNLSELIKTRLSKVSDVYFLGSESTLGMVMEGTIKCIEGAYIHAHAFAAGDLKHYAMTLMQSGVEVIGLIDTPQTKDRVDSALHEVRARGASTITIVPKKVLGEQPTIDLPEAGELTHLVGVVVLQLMAYYWSVFLGHNVDKPRNIAKSVTVV